MSRIKFQVTTRTGLAGTKADPIVQADGDCGHNQIASRQMAHTLGQLVEAAGKAADAGLVTEVAVLVYPDREIL